MPRSPMPGGDFENPEGKPPGSRARAEAGRGASPRARRVAPGIVKIARGRAAEGIVGEDYRTKNPNFLHFFIPYYNRSKSLTRTTLYHTTEIHNTHISESFNMINCFRLR